MLVEFAQQTEFETVEAVTPITTETFISPQGEVLTAVSEAIHTIHKDTNRFTAPLYDATAESIIGALKKDSVILIASTDDQEKKPIGYALLGPPNPGLHWTREVAVLVNHHHRKQGIATRMFIELLTKARELGITHCCAMFSSSNRGVWRLLRSAEQAGLIHHVTEINGPETTVQIALLDQQPE